MRINYSDKINNDQHMVVISTGNNKINSNKSLDIQSEKLLNDYLAEKTSDKEIIEIWSDKNWPYDMLSEVEWLVKEQDKIGNTLKKGNLILTGAYGLPIPINDKELIQVTSSLFGNVSAVFK